MTEPTAEQVERERERAHEIVGEIPCIYAFPDKHNFTCTAFATALARVRIEAHAAGRDEGLRDAKTVSDGQREILKQRYGDYGWLAADDVSDAIRALRGRT